MYKYLFLLASSLAITPHAFAASDLDAAENAERNTASRIIVTASGLPQAIEQSGQPVSVIDRAEIEAIQGADVTRVLRRLPGVTFTRNGALGGLSLMGVRGAASGETLILIDGVRVNDPASTAGEFDLSQLASATIDSIELLRGSNAVVWGSQAISGVMNITTRLENGLSGSVEYGGDKRVTATAAAGYVDERLEAGLSGSFVDEKGFSSASSGIEKDGYRQYNIAARTRYHLTDELSLVANARYVSGRVDLDGFPPPTYEFTDVDAREKLRAWSGRVGAFYQTGVLSLNAGYSISRTKRDGDDPYSPYEIRGRSERVEMFGRVQLPWDLALDFGADHEWSRFSNAPDAGKAHTTSGHALLGLYKPDLTMTAGLRYDDHSLFGGEWTFGANAAYEFLPNIRLRAAYGEGYKAPSLYQLLSQYGNPDLQPEKSRTYELGLAYGQRGDALYLAASAYRRTMRNLIDFTSCWGSSEPLCATRPFGYYVNEERARAQGFELEAGGQIMPGLDAMVVYSHTKTRNRTPGHIYEGNRFGRRPAHLLTGSLDWDSGIGLTLGADLRWVGKSWDNRANIDRLDSYVLGDLRASYDIGDHVTLFGRIENVWNEKYTVASGYNTQGRAAYIGLRLRK